MGKKEEKVIAPALLEPGPHGFPMRWILYLKSCKTLKIATSTDTPLHYIEMHSFRHWKPWQVLHESAHKKDKSPGLVAIYKPRRSFPKSLFLKPKDFLIKFPGRDSDTNIKMELIVDWKRLSGAKGYTLNMPVASTGRSERFAWRKADWGSHCDEIKMTRKPDEPPVHTGDPRPPREEGFHLTKPYAGWILIRLDSPHQRAGGQGLPMGFTELGEEIVASLSEVSGWNAAKKFCFQYWGSGATGELGEDFTRVAALSGSILWDEQERERRARQAKQNANNGSSF